MRTATDGPTWPADPDHREAIDTLLTMAESADRWGEMRLASALLDHVEGIVGRLPQPYERIRWRCRGQVEPGTIAWP